jgi:polar amino acid transport system substrate-binding protein
MLRRRHLGLSLCCLLAAALAPASAAAKDTITLCFERLEVLPWRTLDGGGLNFELLNAVARRTGVEFDYQGMPWKRCLAQLKANQIDGAFAVSFSPDRLALGVFPGGEQADPAKRLHVDRYVLVRRKGSRVDWDGKHFSNLDGRVGFQLGYSVGDFLRALNVPVDEGSQRSDELAEKLVAGRLAAAALGGQDAVRVIRGPLARQLEVLPAPLIEKPYYLAFSHRFAQQHPGLLDRIWKAIAEVRETPAYRQHEHELMAAQAASVAGGRH